MKSTIIQNGQKVGHDPIGNSKELMFRKNMNRNKEGMSGHNNSPGPLHFILVQNKYTFEFQVPRFTRSCT